MSAPNPRPTVGTTCVIDDCARPVDATAYVCSRDTQHLIADMRWIADNANDIDTKISRQTRTGNTVGRRSAETRLPLDWAAVIDADAVHNTLSTWARDMLDIRTGLTPPSDTSAAIAGFIADHIENWYRYRPYADQVWDELANAKLILTRALDTTAGRVYRGPCLADINGHECDEDLYGHVDASHVTCRACGTEHDSSKRREWLMDQLVDQLVPAVMIEPALSVWVDRPPTFAAVRKWIQRRLLLSKGYRLDGTPTYRIGDAIEVANRLNRKPSRQLALSVRLGTNVPPHSYSQWHETVRHPHQPGT